MRVTDVALYSNLEEVVRFSLRSEKTASRFMARQIVGMDAEEITPKFYGKGKVSGSSFYSFGMKPRELVIRVILNPNFAMNEEYHTVRDELYKAISSSRTGKIEVRFYSGASTVAKLEGFITKLEAGYFNKLPEAQLTIRCDDPMFRGTTPVHIGGSDIPATNPLRLSDIISTAPHGFAAFLTFTAALPEFIIQEKQTDPDWTFEVTPDGGFASGDKLHFSSDMANKHLYVLRGGVGDPEHLIDKIEPGSVWPVIFPGANQVYFPDAGSFDIEYVEYYTAYWGV